ncbi:MAG TPA: flagellar basal body-associated FliL family protein [Acetobacteraceae bacterium]|nr:flagellar basal body-associated FliL family protein [Acetobacteraceae bacterium]
MTEQATNAEAAPPRKGRRKLLLLLGVPLLLGGGGAGAWFAGLLPGSKAEAPAITATAAPAEKPVFVDMPDIIANLNAPGRRSSYIKLRSKLEVARAADARALQEAMPRLQDLFTTYLREVRPEELRGSAGTYRLREELMVRASLAAPPAQVTDVLFVELLLQ